jgi:hypothetical protein
MTSADRIVRANVLGTALFVVTALLAAVFFTTALQWVGALTALALFAVGVVCFLWSYLHAVQRSRTDEISVAALYFLAGRSTPRDVKRTMLAMLAVQIVTATATTFARLDGPDGTPGSSLAVGFLVAMFGFGLNGLWSAFHGTFAERQRVGSTPKSPPNQTGSANAGAAIGQNDEHG